MRELPSGTATFLFSDVEGSTRLLTALGDRFRAVHADHQRLMRASFNTHDGIEVSTEGDSFFTVFRSPLNAVEAAADAQRSLAEHDRPDGLEVRVRIGVHTGQAVLAGDNYVGIDVNRTARIAAAGHGGQTLIGPPDRERVDRLLATALSALDPDAEAAARADAAALDAASAVDYALAFGDPSSSVDGSIGGAGIAVERR